MKQLKMLLLAAVSALLMLFVVFVPMRASAATIENGKSVKLLAEGKQFYKFTLDDDSVLQVSWSKNNNNLAYAVIWTDKNRTNSVYGFSPSTASGKEYICLKKGTYYVDMCDGNSSKKPQATMKFTWESGSNYSRGNYSMETAYDLKSGTLEQVAQIRKYSYIRWYKVKLTKTQTLTLQIPYGDPYEFSVLSTKEGWISMNTSNYNSDNKTISSYSKLPAGTYYIMLFDYSMYYGYSTVGQYYAFKWK